MNDKIDPELKKAIWKIVVYAVTVLASLFAGNAAAKNGIHFIPKHQIDSSYVLQEK